MILSSLDLKCSLHVDAFIFNNAHAIDVSFYAIRVSVKLLFSSDERLPSAWKGLYYLSGWYQNVRLNDYQSCFLLLPLITQSLSVVVESKMIIVSFVERAYDSNGVAFLDPELQHPVSDNRNFELNRTFDEASELRLVERVQWWRKLQFQICTVN